MIMGRCRWRILNNRYLDLYGRRLLRPPYSAEDNAGEHSSPLNVIARNEAIKFYNDAVA